MMSILGCSAGELGQCAEGAGLLGRAPQGHARGRARSRHRERLRRRRRPTARMWRRPRRMRRRFWRPRKRKSSSTRRQRLRLEAAAAPSPVADPVAPVVEQPPPLSRRPSQCVEAAEREPSGPTATDAPMPDRPIVAAAKRSRREPATEQWEEVWRPRRKGRAFETAPGSGTDSSGPRQRQAPKGARLPRAGSRAPTSPPMRSPSRSRPGSSRSSRASRSTARTATGGPNGRRGGPERAAGARRAFPCMLRRPSRNRRPSIPTHRSRR